ncbi:MAG TPA: hypothetical protein VHK28_05980 [Candidatus Limnocylindria bacterium]|nr:hypothetical protein [Candidatus Limnocylindria bacterium]
MTLTHQDVSDPLHGLPRHPDLACTSKSGIGLRSTATCAAEIDTAAIRARQFVHEPPGLAELRWETHHACGVPMTFRPPLATIVDVRAYRYGISGGYGLAWWLSWRSCRTAAWRARHIGQFFTRGVGCVSICRYSGRAAARTDRIFGP